MSLLTRYRRNSCEHKTDRLKLSTLYDFLATTMQTDWMKRNGVRRISRAICAKLNPARSNMKFEAIINVCLRTMKSVVVHDD